MFQPDLMVDGVHQVSAELLAELGVQGVLIDLDDTLLPSTGDALDAASEAWVRGLQRAGIPIVILSNGERGRVARLAERFGIEALALSGKPLRSAFRRALALLGTPPERTAMIGDQVFTDVLGANLAGLVSILVRPLTPGKLPHTRWVRHLERMILRGGERGRPVHR